MKSLCNTSFRKANISFSHCLDTNIVLQSCGGASVEVEHRNTKVPGYKDDLLAYFPCCVHFEQFVMRITLTRFPAACGIVSRYSSSSLSFSFSSPLMSSIKMFNDYFHFQPNDQVVSWKFGNNYVYPTKQVSLFILFFIVDVVEIHRNFKMKSMSIQH